MVNKRQEINEIKGKTEILWRKKFKEKTNKIQRKEFQKNRFHAYANI